MSKIYLTKNKDSWVELLHLPQQLLNQIDRNIDNLWGVSPGAPGVVMVPDKRTQEYYPKTIFRSYKSYLNVPESKTQNPQISVTFRQTA